MSNDGDILVQGFRDIGPDGSGSLQWFCAPDRWGLPHDDNNNDQREGRGGSWSVDEDANQLTITPPAKKDYWRKTYYRPIMIKDDGPFLHNNPLVVPLDTSAYYTLHTIFDLTATRQFDQAGIMIRINAEHWIKTGIEVVDGKARLSCVVTNHGYSDWSTQPWRGPTATTSSTNNNGGPILVVQKVPLRVHWRAGSVVVESQYLNDDDTAWDFVRIAHLEAGSAATTTFQAGVFACTPVDQRGGKAVFYDFSIRTGSHVEHNADDV
uniref:Uncharacterized protein n=2 Tax=Amphora coffeiformis TaxID=265554 RepID=A0A7S3L4I2_9STRA|mmetsp:Transcript_3847/g.7689  ORF Transcript_3847/g.7689 Transcript_3847/m.7689 type:complete len:266 (+) Transcript_3847:147-944(+)